MLVGVCERDAAAHPQSGAAFGLVVAEEPGAEFAVQFLVLSVALGFCFCELHACAGGTLLLLFKSEGSRTVARSVPGGNAKNSGQCPECPRR